MSANTAIAAMVLAAIAWRVASAGNLSIGQLVGFADRMTADQVYAIADQLGRAYFPSVDTITVTAMAKVESSFRPGASRHEPGYPRGDGTYGDWSTGLMQTLESTAQWLHDQMGYRAFPRPSRERLYDPVTSIYYGMAYLDYLSRFRGIHRGEEFIVRSYNGGPDDAASSNTAHYWAKYLAAKAEVMAELGLAF